LHISNCKHSPFHQIHNVPLLKYCSSCMWHHNLTKELSLQIKSIQKRAIRIIFMPKGYCPTRAHCTAQVYHYYTPVKQTKQDTFSDLLSTKTCVFMRCCYQQAILISFIDSCLHEPGTFLALTSGTKKYQSFLNYGLLHYQ